MPDELDASFESDASPTEDVVELTPEETLGNQFLSNIPEQDRPIVAKYVKDWDGKVTKKFQSIHDKYRPYKDMGELEELQKAYQFYGNFRSNGEQMFTQMLQGYIQHYGADAPRMLMEALGVSDYQNGQQQSQDQWDYSQGEPTQQDVQFQNMQEELNQLREFQQQQIEFQQTQELEKQLDAILDQMHTARPDIPQEVLLQGIAAGIEPNTIVSNYDNLVKSIGSQRQRPNPPTVMGAGQGGLPSSQVDVAKLDAKGRKSLIEQYLAASSE